MSKKSNYIFERIAIIGTGLIGGSIGLAVKKRRLAKEIIGVCRRMPSCRRALRFKTVDRATMSIREGVYNADFVVIATPVGRVVEVAEKVMRYMKNGSILTDVGSTKSQIVKRIEKFVSKGIYFVGTHPMSGSEKRGPENATADLFVRNPLIITKTKNTNMKAVSVVKKFWEMLGSRVYVIPLKEHDNLIALVSYLPHAISSALVLSQNRNSIKFVSTGFKDLTRISSSAANLWEDIFFSADKSLLNAIDIFSEKITYLKKIILNNDHIALRKFLRKAKKIRDGID